MLTLTAAITAMTTSNMGSHPNLSGQTAVLWRSTGTCAQVETDGHGDRNHPPETAEYGDQSEGVRIGLGLCRFLLTETNPNLLDHRCRHFSLGEKMTSPVLRDRFVGNLLGPPRRAFASFGQVSVRCRILRATSGRKSHRGPILKQTMPNVYRMHGNRCAQTRHSPNFGGAIARTVQFVVA
jgi:hypothetical protein